MSATGEQRVARTQQPPPIGPPRPSALRLSGALRFGIALLIAGGLTAALIVAMWGHLNVKSTVIGYPVYYDFNPYNYSRAYEITVVFFPLATLGIFYALTWLSPRLGVATPGPRGAVRPRMRDADAVEPAEPDDLPSTLSRRLGGAWRGVFVGAVLGIEVGIAADHLWPAVALTAIAYCLVAAAAAALLVRFVGSRHRWDVALATVNAVGCALPIAGLALVSAHTELTVLAGDVRHPYHWCPVWVAIPLAIVVGLGIVVTLVRSEPVGSIRLERRAVLMLAAPTLLFLLTAHLPGDIGQIGLFERGQQVTETMLIGRGWLPWRDVFLAHGLLGDVAPTAVGWGLFGNSFWGADAGYSFVFVPLGVITMYMLMAYIVRRSWPLVLIAGLIYIGSWFGTADSRYVVWPLVLLLLTALLKRATPVRAIALGLLVVAQGVAMDELAPAVPIAIAVVAVYEWYWRGRNTPWHVAFRRTILLTATVFGGVLAFVIYMTIRGALGAVIYDTLALVPGHTLDGGNPPAITGASSAEFHFIALAPICAVLIAMAYVVIKLRLRRPFLLADWPMGMSAVFAFFYYTKFLARMDLGHAYEPFLIATPLMLYIVYRGIVAIEHWIRALPRLQGAHWRRWLPAYPVAVALLIIWVVSFWSPMTAQVKATPSYYRATSPVPATVRRVGYSSQVDVPAIHDLKRVMNTYLGRHGRVYDITNEPALFYYFLGRDPTSRWFAPNGLTQTPQLQDNVIDDLRRNPPKLIVFDDTDSKMYGLEAMDAIPTDVRLYLISRWILQHYRPLMESHGRIIYLRRGVRPIPVSQLHLTQRPVTTGVQMLGQACLWGNSPTFLTGAAQPGPDATSAPTGSTVWRPPAVTVTGWAGDLRDGEAARQVVATLRGRIVARATPDIPRPDVPQHGYPAGFRDSGYELTIPSADGSAKDLRVFAVGHDGSVAELPIPGQTPLHGAATLGRTSVRLAPKADVGSVDSLAPSTGALRITPPTGKSWADYQWLEIDALGTTGFATGSFDLSDIPGTPNVQNAGHVINFDTMTRSPRRYIVPVASCEQWQGYGSRPLYLSLPPGQRAPAVRLIR